MTSHWLYKGKILQEVPAGQFGFVYEITNKLTDKKYIGRKYFGKTRRVKKKGQTRRTVKRTESDWRTYTGSSKQLNKDIAKHGKSKFTFEIVIVAKTKGQVNYLEENIQHRRQVILREDYYNDCIGSRKWLSVKIPPEISKKLLSESR